MCQIVPNCLFMIFMANNGIDKALRAGYTPGSVRQMLRAQINFSHTKYCPQVSAITLTLKSKEDQSFKRHNSK